MTGPLNWREMLAALPERPLASTAKMHPLAHQRFRDQYPPGRPARPVVADLCGIPIAVDETLPEGVWQLVDSDGKVLHEGNVNGGQPKEQPLVTEPRTKRRTLWRILDIITGRKDNRK